MITHLSGPLIKLLREKKRISRRELSKRTALSTYQVEGLEGRNADSLLSRVFLCVKALGYSVNDVLSLMGLDYGDLIRPKGTLGKPSHETHFKEGVKLLTYLQESDRFFGQLQLAPGKSLNRDGLPACDLLLGIVREGTLVIDALVKQAVHKKDCFFILPGVLPVEFVNAETYAQTSALLFSVKSPQNRPNFG